MRFHAWIFIPWITERGVEYGFDVYEIENTTRWLASQVVLGKAMIFIKVIEEKVLAPVAVPAVKKQEIKKRRERPG